LTPVNPASALAAHASGSPAQENAMAAIDLETRRDPGASPTNALIAAACSPESPHWVERLRDGSTVLIRPIGPGDAALERTFIQRLSPQTQRFRFLGQMHDLSNAQLRRFTDIDYERDVAFVALVHEDGEKREIGVCRYCLDPTRTEGECAIVVADAWQGRGLGVVLMRHLIEFARARGVERLYSIDSAENFAMRGLAGRLGFERHADPDDASQVIHSVKLTS
jgi:GNAT superfamily N-acetyltransferase